MRSTAPVAGAMSLLTLVPTLLVAPAAYEVRFRDVQRWIDPNSTQDALFHGASWVEQWAQPDVTTVAWVLAPLGIGVLTLLGSEVE